MTMQIGRHEISLRARLRLRYSGGETIPTVPAHRRRFRPRPKDGVGRGRGEWRDENQAPKQGGAQKHNQKVYLPAWCYAIRFA
jgi:hypothetical protein